MRHGYWLIFAAPALIAAAVLLRDDPEPAHVREHSPNDERAASVRVSHEFVTVAIPTGVGSRAGTSQLAAAQRSANTRGAARTSQLAARPAASTVRPATRDPNLLEKARRAFLGDGRHKPEPFPRVRDN
jgi:hypothetical protein